MRINSVLISISLLFTICKSYCQVDTISIVEKAKLLTTDRHGLRSIDVIIADILCQPHIILEIGSEQVIFVKIDFAQKNFYKETSRLAWLGECSFYVAYYIPERKFYRLGGFDTNDVISFIEDIGSEFYTIMRKKIVEENSEIDFLCMLDYYSMSPKKRKRKGLTCFPTCSGTMYQELRVN